MKSYILGKLSGKPEKEVHWIACASMRRYKKF